MADTLRSQHAEYQRRRRATFVQQVERALTLARRSNSQSQPGCDQEGRLQVRFIQERLAHDKLHASLLLERTGLL